MGSFPVLPSANVQLSLPAVGPAAKQTEDQRHRPSGLMAQEEGESAHLEQIAHQRLFFQFAVLRLNHGTRTAL